uniref:Uncharacterized protein n=1 Tax=Homalodisca liturata TaxID=320908 RepID=A0A1B6HFN7_9HEMI
MSESPILSFDPLPPVDSINLYSRPTRYQNPSAFYMFFRSLMPNFNPNQTGGALEEPGEMGEEGDGEGAAVDLRRSVTSLLDAMRDLLSNIHMPDVPAEGDIDSDEERP